MYDKFQQFLKDELAAIEEAGLYKNERVIASPQGQKLFLRMEQNCSTSVLTTIWVWLTVLS